MYENEKKAGRVVGTFLADFLYYACLLGVGVISWKLISKILKVAITYEAMRSARKNNQQNQNFYTEDFE